MVIELVKTDITTLKSDVDIIVNAANETLLGGGGVDGAIHKAAGQQLKKECKKIGHCDPGEAVITKAYNLQNKYIIHTVGPRYHLSKNPSQILTNCYINSLKIADAVKANVIAFPSIGTGAFYYPLNEAAHIAIKMVKNYPSKYVKKVIFCFIDDETYEACANALYNL